MVGVFVERFREAPPIASVSTEGLRFRIVL
jgi:hypothetical protein